MVQPADGKVQVVVVGPGDHDQAVTGHSCHPLPAAHQGSGRWESLQSVRKDQALRMPAHQGACLPPETG